MILRARQHWFEFPRAPIVLGSLNLCTPGTPAGQAKLTPVQISEARALVEDGAQIIVISMGDAERETDVPEEKDAAERLGAFVRAWSEAGYSEPLAVHTPHPLVARAMLELGVDILFEPVRAPVAGDADPSRGSAYARLCAESGAALVLDYAVGGDSLASAAGACAGAIETAERLLEEKLRASLAAGLSEEAVIIGLRLERIVHGGDALLVCAQLHRFHKFGRPLLLTETKEPSGEGSDFEEVSERRAAGMVSRMVRGVLAGVHLFNGHPVAAAALAVRTVSAVLA
ncbi:MAG: Dihydropteroate synthase [Verrucomicrobia bacterium]|nr:MAG: Dihydropteroate synthase [Verrucomicrobiota bacterium]